jgi:aryl-alcohol dehydrogenase (NADP+)
MALTPCSPLKGGFLSGKYRRGAPVADSARTEYVGGPSDAEFDVIDRVAAIADELETTSAAVALAWLIARPQTVVPIVGARHLEHLEGNLAGLDVMLTSEHLRVLDEVSAPKRPAPIVLAVAVRVGPQRWRRLG